MSLINQMLQDLDARSTEGGRGASIPSEVRAVPESGKSSLGWWLALVLAILLGGAASSWWWWQRTSAPAANVQQAAPPPELALKLAPDLRVTRSEVLPWPIADDKNAPLPSADMQPLATAQQAATKVPDLPRQEEQQKKAPKSALQSAAPMPDNTPTAVPAASPMPVKRVNASAATPVKKEEKDEAARKPEVSTPLSLSKQVKELTPQQRAENEYRKALALMQQGKANEAITGLEQALLLDPLHAAARQTFVGVLLENKRQDDAVRKLQEGLNLDPGQPGMAMILARLQLAKDELRTAVETLQRTLPYAADRADYHAFLAALLQRQTRHKEAIEHYLAALRKSSQNGVWWMGLGISLQAENRVIEAREAFTKAKATNSLSAELLAFVEQRLGQL